MTINNFKEYDTLQAKEQKTMRDRQALKDVSEYDLQAWDFCRKNSVTVTKTYTGHRPHFDNEGPYRAVYSITISRPGKQPYTFNFGASLVDSYKVRTAKIGRSLTFAKDGNTAALSLPAVERWLQNPYERKGHGPLESIQGMATGYDYQIVISKNHTPSDYDILSCLTSYDPGSFADFCSDFGYEEDSRKALTTWEAVCREWAGVSGMFHDCLEELSEIN